VPACRHAAPWKCRADQDALASSCAGGPIGMSTSTVGSGDTAAGLPAELYQQ
jgi:hypothetical protein